jgi:hypothetical protein
MLMALTGTDETGFDPESVDSHSLHVIEQVMHCPRLWLAYAVTNLTKALHFRNHDAGRRAVLKRRSIRPDREQLSSVHACVSLTQIKEQRPQQPVGPSPAFSYAARCPLSYRSNRHGLQSLNEVAALLQPDQSNQSD